VGTTNNFVSRGPSRKQTLPVTVWPGGTQILFHRAAYSGTDTQVGGFFVLTMRNKHIRRLTAVRIRYDADAAWGR
jgi:hypothetical protein